MNKLIFPVPTGTLNRKRLSLAVAGAVVLAASIGAIAADDKPDPKNAAAAVKPALTVTTTRALPASLPVKLAANGNVSAWQEALIGSESSGLRLLEVRANVGDVVKKGQVLAVFAAESVQADVAQARAALLEAQATAAEASANAARARTLQSSGALSAQQIGQYMTAEQTANARIAAAKATLAVQQVRLNHARVLAPDHGVISSRSATVGAVPGPGTELFRMIRQGRLEWRAEVTAAELSRLTPGMAARVKAANGSELTGKVRMIAPTIDPQTRTALVYVDLPTSAGQNAPFKAGMFASGRFELGTTQAMTVPQQAVAVRDGFSYVFLLGADQRVTRQKVQTGRRIDGQIEIVSGLKPAAVVVVSGAGFLNDGDMVRNVAAGVPSAKPSAKPPAK
ncbi:efflux RND transporter periplasmic adaptor subunit [Massilia glaciei]|uniref:Efflux RND transporter periplasmic adaptor subunit n=1 Tax=Massilia glaciei TaxID=1524097 RepID=A0A2U2HNE0_9BURK|nr:efflux RND transporter periplasmic adaptor subunit [Massilia glaciei]PWF48946.1 efflux RND transporter periplasmic adaptor subunit [Massilia glaciei]